MQRHSLLALAATSVLFCTSAFAETPLERGEYLVNAVMGCDGCHTPRGPGGFDMSKRFSGGSVVFDTPAFTVTGSNITPDRDTGIGTWTANDLKRALIEGVRPNGVPIAPQMPFEFYKILTPGDLDAIVAYVQSVPAVRKDVTIPQYKTAFPEDHVPGTEKPMAQADLNDKLKRGFYLATLAHCMECHARAPDGSQDYKNRYGKGGHAMKGPWGSITVANITSHATSGIGGWTDAEIKRALTQGLGRDGRAFKSPMARQIYFAKMKDEDLDAMIAWVRTLPPIE